MLKILGGLLRGEEHIGSVTEPIVVVPSSGRLRRPANTTAYTIGDTIAQFADGTLVQPLVFAVARRKNEPVAIRRLRIYTNDTGWRGLRIRAYVYRELPALVAGAGDNLAFATALQTMIGTLSGSFIQNDDGTAVISDGGLAILTPDAGSAIDCLPNDGGKNVHVLLQALGAGAPSANSTEFWGVMEAVQGHS